MTNGSDQGDSFDPRSWLDAQKRGAGSAEPRKPEPGSVPEDADRARDTTSFDPKDWGVSQAAKPARNDSQTGMDEAKPVRAGSSRSARLVPAAVGLALLIAGAGFYYLRSGNESAVPAPADEAAQAANAAQTDRGAGTVKSDDDNVGLRSLKLISSLQVAQTLEQAGIDKKTARDVAARIARSVTPGKEIDLEFGLLAGPAGAGPKLVFARATEANGSGVKVTVGPDGLSHALIKEDLKRQVTAVRGELDADSFYTSAVSAGVIDSLISDFANAFSFDFNLASEVTPGDVFEVAYAQKVNPRGESVGKPQLLFVSLTTAEKSKELYRFLAPGEKVPGWFDANGTSTVKALMRTPIDGARITSNFGMRFHPVLKYNRLHGGTDFAAPVGTPIYAAASGTVTSVTPSRCAGNMAILAHDKGYATRYFHLSRYAPGLHAGKKVQQGETIGFVGNTGTCTTGPHLHYEVHIGGQKVDPLSIDTGESKKLDAKVLPIFFKVRDDIDRARADAAS